MSINSISNISESDFKLINDLLRRVIELENLYRLITNQPKVDDLEKQIKRIFEILETKADKEDIIKLKAKDQELYELYLDLLSRLKNLEDKFNKYDFDKMLKDINNLKEKVDNIIKNLLNSNNSNINIDFGDYVKYEEFDKFRTHTNEEIEALKKMYQQLKNLIDELYKLLDTKADKDMLIIIENNFFKALEDFKIAAIKRFADKNDTNNNFRLLEEQIKLLMEGKHDADNWLLAKKPMGGNYCASCETYIGDLKENNEYLAWKQWPSKDDRNVRKGPGFSKMLQLINSQPIINVDQWDNLNKIYKRNKGDYIYKDVANNTAREHFGHNNSKNKDKDGNNYYYYSKNININNGNIGNNAHSNHNVNNFNTNNEINRKEINNLNVNENNHTNNDDYIINSKKDTSKEVTSRSKNNEINEKNSSDNIPNSNNASGKLPKI